MELNGSTVNITSVIYFLVEIVKVNYFNVLEYDQPILIIRKLWRYVIDIHNIYVHKNKNLLIDVIAMDRKTELN